MRIDPTRLKRRVLKVVNSRPPDLYIGGKENPYMLRWHIVKSKALSVYAHLFMRSDDDRALHDHPSGYVSVILDGSYVEERILAGGVHVRKEYKAGDVIIRPRGSSAHRVEIVKPCLTLFIRGPVYREWGFHCPQAGWVHWTKFIGATDYGATGGPGCGDAPTPPAKRLTQTEVEKAFGVIPRSPGGYAECDECGLLFALDSNYWLHKEKTHAPKP